MNAIDLLKQQHAQAKDLYVKYRESDDADEKHALFDEIADTLAAHALIEERLLYPSLLSSKLEHRLDDVIQEHQEMKRELAELIANAPDDADFERRLEVLFDMVARHVEQEEHDVLPQVAEQLSADESQRLAADMQRMFDELMNEAPSETLPFASVTLR